MSSGNTSSSEESPSVLYRGGSIIFGDIWTASPAMKECLGLARKIAALDIEVLIIGETGTGKNLLARAMHNASHRSDGPFVEFNTAAIPSSLAEDTLFGHEPEAFTEAKTRRRGLFERASGGTLFLDEIGNMTLEVQAKILSAVESKKISRLGGEEEVRCDVRMICATNADLTEAISAGDFRSDLYFRLAGHVMRVPPLRERLEDLPMLLERFLKLDNASYNRSVTRVSDACRGMILRHPWPGNIREFRRRLGSAVALCEGPELQPAHVFPEAIGQEPKRQEAGEEPLSLSAIEREHISKVLAMTRWNISEAASLLEISRPTLRKKIKDYGLRKPAT